MSVLQRVKGASRLLPSAMADRVYSQSLGLRVRSGRFTSAEPEFSRLSLLVPADENVIDGGANFGIFALAMAPLLRPGRWVFAFEPVLKTRRILMKQVERSGMTNVAIFPAALSDTDGFVGLSAPKFEDGRENLYRSQISAASTPDSLALRGEFLEGLGPIGFVKLDVEGHEEKALKGLAAVLKTYHPNLLIEGHLAAVETYLSGFGYESIVLEGSPNSVFVSTSRDPSGSVLSRLAELPSR